MVIEDRLGLEDLGRNLLPNELRILVAPCRDKILGWTTSGHGRCDWDFNEPGCVTAVPRWAPEGRGPQALRRAEGGV